jgi:hypothetical protein
MAEHVPEPVDWTELYRDYAGKWVALKDDEETVIASGETLEEAQERATEKGAEDPIFTRVPEESLPFVG